MIEIRPSTAAEFPARRELWKTSFGDDEAFIDMFFRGYSKPEDTVVLLEDGVLRSMATILPFTVHYPDETSGRVGYIYALCTDPAARTKGFVRKLLGYVDTLLKDQGYDCAALVPAEASLHRFFDMLGFRECFSNRTAEALLMELPQASASDRIEPVEADVYGAIRERLLEKQFHISYSDRLLDFQRTGSRMFGGDLFRIVVGGEEGCAVAEPYGPRRVMVKELLMRPDLIPRAVTLISQVLPACHYHLRTPSFWEGLPGSYVQSFGMVKWYHPHLERLWFRERQAYLGLGYD